MIAVRCAQENRTTPAPAGEEPGFALNDRTLQRRINLLRRTDNVTNWFYLGREYLCGGLVAGVAILFFQNRAAWDLPWLWNIPVEIVAMAMMGVVQHRLVTLGHEGSHYLLFRSKVLNELASDFCCMMPMWSNTHLYRLQHLAHHQFPNDPERDPDLRQVEASGYKIRFPMPVGEFLWKCGLQQLLWLPGLFRYTQSRSLSAAMGNRTGSYSSLPGRSPLLMVIGIGYLAVLALALVAIVRWGQVWQLIAMPFVMLAGMTVFHFLVPESWYRRHHLLPVVSPRLMTLIRVGYFTCVFTALAVLSRFTGRPWVLYYILLWLVPIGTSFSLLMLIRQVVQHGNAGRGRFDNTRVYLVGPLVRYAVFPLGGDYHLPHHLFQLVPHYRLAELHELLMEVREYREQACVVEGYFRHRRPPQHPTVVELIAKDIGRAA